MSLFGKIFGGNANDPDIDPTTGKPWELTKDEVGKTNFDAEQAALWKRQAAAMKAAIKAGKTVDEAKAEAAKVK